MYDKLKQLGNDLIGLAREYRDTESAHHSELDSDLEDIIDQLIALRTQL